MAFGRTWNDRGHILAAVLLALTPMALPASAAESKDVDSRLQELFGQERLGTVQKPDGVELFRVPKQPLPEEKRRTVQFSAGWPIFDRKTGTAILAGAVSKIVLEPGSYNFPMPGTVYLGNFCGEFQPAFVIRLSRADHPTIDFLLGTLCLDLGVLQPKGRKWDPKAEPFFAVRSDGVALVPLSEQGAMELLAVTAIAFDLDAHLRTKLATEILRLRGRLQSGEAVQPDIAPGDRSPAAPARR
jgi:hypothetical protein